MALLKRKLKRYAASFMKHDLKASVNVFLEALPLCIGVALASGVSLSAGFIAGMVGGLAVLLINRSTSLVFGPGAGLITVSAAAVTSTGSVAFFFAAVFLAGFFQLLLGGLSMGRLTYFIPSVVTRGMLAAIGLLLIIKQLPFTLGYDHLEFTEGEYLKVLAIRDSIEEISDFDNHFSLGVVIISLVAVGLLWLWEKKLSRKISYLPTYLIVVSTGIAMALLYRAFVPGLVLKPSHYIHIPRDIMANFQVYNIVLALDSMDVWRSALIICVVATIESLAAIDAIDKIDSVHRVTPKNNALVAMGAGNMLSGLLGGLPIITLVARSTTNVESGARTRLATLFQALWLLAAVFLTSYFVNHIPYCVLAVILIRIGLRLIDPELVYTLYRAGKYQFYPFMTTVVTILFAGIVVGLLVGIVYSFYCLVKSSYADEFVVNSRNEGHLKHYTLKLAANVNFLNKKSIVEVLDNIPDYSIVEVIGSNHGRVDFDIVEIFAQFKTKARHRHIEFITKDVPGLTALGHAT